MTSMNEKTSKLLAECSELCKNLNEMLLLAAENKIEPSEMIIFKKAVSTFCSSLNRICSVVNERSNAEIKKRLMRTIYEMNGVNCKDETSKSRNNRNQSSITTKPLICPPEVVSFDDFANALDDDSPIKQERAPEVTFTDTSYANSDGGYKAFETIISARSTTGTTTDLDEFSLRNPPSIPPFDINS